MQGCICPHPPLLIPEVGGPSLAKVATTVAAMKRLAGEVGEPQTVVVISPHSDGYGDAHSHQYAHAHPHADSNQHACPEPAGRTVPDHAGQQCPCDQLYTSAGLEQSRLRRPLPSPGGDG